MKVTLHPHAKKRLIERGAIPKAITLDPNYHIAWEQFADAKRALQLREQSKMSR
jgi:hypothetical protein